MTLEKMFELAQEFAVTIFTVEGSIIPTFIGQDEDGHIHPIACAFEDEDAVTRVAPEELKDFFAGKLRTFFREKEIVRYVSILEAWMIESGKATKKDEADLLSGRLPVKDHPNRVEVVHVTAEDGTKILSGTFRILRDANRKPRLSQFQPHTDSMQHAGRFIGLLPRHGTLQ